MFTKKTTLLLLRILERIVSDKILHSRWLNTLSYLEYIGARKILKSLPARILNKTFLEHINEEARHSLFFKNLAQNTAQNTLSFKERELLAPQAGNDYFQQIDHYTIKFSSSNPVISYLYTTYTVEQRALIVYSLYNDLLKRKAISISLQSILNEEREHLRCVFEKIQDIDPLWEKNLEDIIHFEHQQYFSFLISLERAVFDLPVMQSFPKFKKEQDTSYHKNI